MIKPEHIGTQRVPTRTISREAVDKLFSSVGQRLRAGLSGEAEKVLRDAIKAYRHTPDDGANLKRLLSFTLETTGKYKEALDAIAEYENESLSPSWEPRPRSAFERSWRSLSRTPVSSQRPSHFLKTL